MREPKKKEPANTDRRTNESLNLKQETRRYRFLTYVMGGGVKVDGHNKYPDDRTPIRAASIRGQLRFWWRACNPSGCKTIEELRTREAEIWGSAEKPSAVTISVMQSARQTKDVKVYDYVPNRNGILVFQELDHMRDLAYATFPLQPKDKSSKNRIPAGILHDYGDAEFSVSLKYPTVSKKDVEMALWAWETFGGLGARTRRGFGAIERSDKPSTIGEIRSKLKELKQIAAIPDVPSLSGATLELSTIESKSEIEAWKHALRQLKMFRQGEGVGRNGRRGRSLWPEADAIRDLTKQSVSRHRTRMTIPNAFPRAQFGMPIIFHFKDGGDDPKNRSTDPTDTQLKPANADRMASPLILRPIRDGDGYRPAALLLWTNIPGSIVLKTKVTEIPITVDVTPNQARSITALRGNPDPLERFLEEFKK